MLTQSSANISATASELAILAPFLDALVIMNDSSFFFDVMTESIIWNDEMTSEIRSDRRSWSLRPLFYYRSTVILKQPDTQYENHWVLGKHLFPNWPGFAPERTAPSDEVVAFLKDKIQNVARNFDRAMAAIKARQKNDCKEA
jgi:hypothetical protein